jgi:hypothetical protein
MHKKKFINDILHNIKNNKYSKLRIIPNGFSKKRMQYCTGSMYSVFIQAMVKIRIAMSKYIHQQGIITGMTDITGC